MDSRRRFLQALLAGSAAGLAGCTEDGGNGDTGATGTTTGQTDATTQEDMVSTLRIWGYTSLNVEEYDHLYANSDVEELEFTPAPSAVGEMTSQVLQGGAVDQYAVAVQASTMEDSYCQELRELDPDRIDRWDEIPEFFFETDAVNDPVRCNDKVVGMPFIANADSFVYNADNTGELDSYGAWFDEQFEGRVALEDNWATSMSKTALYLKENNMADIDDPANMEPDEIETTTDFLIEHKQRGQFKAFWNGFGNAVELLTTGEVDIMDGWYPMMLAARGQGIEGAQYADTDEGYHKFSVNSHLFDGAEMEKPGMEKLAYQYLNWQLSGFYGASIVSQVGYVTASPLAEQYAEENPDQFNADFVKQRYDDILRGKLQGKGYWTNKTPEHRDTYEEEWQRFKNA